MKFRKKPIVVEAWQYLAGNVPYGICLKSCPPCDGDDEPHVHTMHNNQPIPVALGDWIIREPDRVHYYPCKPDIFLRTYEKEAASIRLPYEDDVLEYLRERTAFEANAE